MSKRWARRLRGKIRPYIREVLRRAGNDGPLDFAFGVKELIAEGFGAKRSPRRMTYANVWDALTDGPDDAANMSMRSNLLIALQQKVKSW